MIQMAIKTKTKLKTSYWPGQYRGYSQAAVQASSNSRKKTCFQCGWCKTLKPESSSPFSVRVRTSIIWVDGTNVSNVWQWNKGARETQTTRRYTCAAAPPAATHCCEIKSAGRFVDYATFFTETVNNTMPLFSLSDPRTAVTGGKGNQGSKKLKNVLS